MMSKTALKGYLKRQYRKSRAQRDRSEFSLKSLNEKLASIWGIFFSVLKFGLAILLLYYFVKEMSATVLVVRPVPVPDSLSKRGLTPEVMASRIASQMVHIDQEANAPMPHLLANEKKLATAIPVDIGSQPDIQIPGQSISFRSLVHFLKGKSEKRGDVTIVADVIETEKSYVSRIRVDGGEYTGQQYSVTFEKSRNPEEYSDNIAEAAMHAAMPYILAVYKARNEKIKCERSKTCVYAEPMAIFDELLANKIVSDNKWALLGRSNLEGMLGKYEDAIEDLRLVTDIDPKLAVAYNNWGFLLFGMNKYDEAILKFKRAIELDPKDVFSYINLGNSLAYLNRHEQAVEEYKLAAEINPDIAKVYFNWGVSLQELKKFEEASKKYMKALELDPRYAEAYTNWGSLFIELDNYKEAIEKSKKAIAIEPKNAVAYFNWASSLQELNRHEEAIGIYREAIEISPNNALYYINYGNVLAHLNRNKEAIVQYKRAIDLNPKLGMAYYNWATVLKKIGREREAVEKSRKAKELGV